MLNVYNKAKTIKEIRNCFPSLAYSDLVYLDNAASSQTVDSAIKQLVENFKAGNMQDSLTATKYSNIKRMQEVHLE